MTRGGVRPRAKKTRAVGLALFVGPLAKRSARGVNFLRQRRAEEAAESGKIFHGAQRDELARDVANGGAFEGE